MSKKKGKSGRNRRAANVKPFSKTDTRTETQMHEDAKRRQDEIDDGKYDRMCRSVEASVDAAIEKMDCSPRQETGQETPTHWEDGEPKTPRELRIEARAKKEGRAGGRWSKRIQAQRDKHTRMLIVKVKHIDAINLRLGRIERALRMRRRVRA